MVGGVHGDRVFVGLDGVRTLREPVVENTHVIACGDLPFQFLRMRGDSQ